MISARQGETIHALQQNSLYGRTETGVIDGCAPALYQARGFAVSEGMVRIGGREYEYGGGNAQIPTVPDGEDPRFYIIVLTTGGAGGVETDVIEGEPAPLNKSLSSLDGDISRLKTPTPPDVANGSVPLAAVLAQPSVSVINTTLWDDVRVAVAPKTTRTITARPGEVQAAFNILSDIPGGTVELVGGADYQTEVGMSDQPWRFQNTNLDGKTAMIGTPSNTEPAIIFDPGFYGGIRNLRINVPAGHDMESQSDSRGIIDWDLTEFDINSAFYENDISALRYYPRSNVIDNVSIVGPDVLEVGAPADLARTAAVRVREAGQGTGVCGLNFHTQGMRNSLHVRAEGGPKPSGDPGRIGYLNGFWGQISSFNMGTDFVFENVDSLGANKHQFQFYSQPNPAASQRFIELKTTSSITNRAMVQNWMWGHFWDTQKYNQAHNGSLMLCDGTETAKNWIWNNAQVSNTFGEAPSPVETRNGAGDNNGFVDMQDIARTSLKHPEGFSWTSAGSVIGRVGGLGLNIEGNIPPSERRVNEAMYPSYDSGGLVWGVVGPDGEYREESTSPRKHSAVQSATTLSDLNGSDWYIPVLASGTGGFTIEVPENHTDFGGAPLAFGDIGGDCSDNPVSLTQLGDRGSIQGKNTLDHDGEWLVYRSNGYQLKQVGGGWPGMYDEIGTSPDTVTTNVDNVETASEQIVFKDTGSGS